MMDMKLVYLCIYIAEGVTAWGYFSTLYAKKFPLWVNIAAYSLGYTVAFLVYNFAYVWVNTSVFAIINFILLYGFHTCSWKAGVFHAGMLTCLSTGLEFVVVIVLGVIWGDYNFYQSSALALTILAVCSKLLFFLSTKICLLIAKRSDTTGKDFGPVSLLLSCFSIATIFVMVVMFYTGLEVSLPVHIENLMLISSLILLFANILLFAGYQYSQKVNQQNLSLRMVKQKDEAEETYFRALEEKYEEQRVVIHDIRRHLTAIKGLAQEQKADRLVEYTAALEALPVLQSKIRYCDNPLMNVVLSRYGELCYEKGIAFHVDIRDKEYDFLLPSDMTALFGNLLENAVEAAEGVVSPYVELRVDSPAGTGLFISLTNPCSQPPQKDGLGEYLTHKRNKEQHGIGLKSVHSIVKKYGGSINEDYDSVTNLFHTSVLLKDED